jgi:hypothetical protein
MAEDILLILCRRDGRYIAGALNFIGGDTLYGRNWGCIEDHRFLHFEACYYQAIDFAIARGLARVEAGAQGGHKVARGYRPSPPTAPTGSPTRAFAGRSPITWSGSGPTCGTTSPTWRPMAPSRRPSNCSGRRRSAGNGRNCPGDPALAATPTRSAVERAEGTPDVAALCGSEREGRLGTGASATHAALSARPKAPACATSRRCALMRRTLSGPIRSTCFCSGVNASSRGSA